MSREYEINRLKNKNGKYSSFYKTTGRPFYGLAPREGDKTIAPVSDLLTLFDSGPTKEEKAKMDEVLYYTDLIDELWELIYKGSIYLETQKERIKARKKDIEIEENGIQTKQQSQYAKDLLEILERVKTKQELGGDYITLLKEEINVLILKRWEVINKNYPETIVDPTLIEKSRRARMIKKFQKENK